jgi:hypothetical protein
MAKQHSSINGVLGFCGLVICGLGYYFYDSYSVNQQAKNTLTNTINSINRYKSLDLYPSQENLEIQKKLVTEYDEKVKTLIMVLKGLQPKAEVVSDTAFQAKLKKKISEIKTFTKDKKMALPADFTLGFSEYVNELPKTGDVATELSNYLDANDALVRLLAEQGAQSLDSFERSVITAEKALKAEKSKSNQTNSPDQSNQGQKLTDKKQLKLTFTADQAQVQAIFSALASPSIMSYFTSVRQVRIENEKQEAPMKSITLENKTGLETLEVEPEKSDQKTTKKSSEVQPAAADSLVVLGNEKLKVYLEIDLVTFLNTPAANSR